MSLIDWLFTHHPFFISGKKHIYKVVCAFPEQSFDDLVVNSRRPFRTVLLILERLVREGKVSVKEGMVKDCTKERAFVHHWPFYKEDQESELDVAFMELLNNRETPSLIWGQRRLIPSSAISRAQYILNQMRNTEGRIVFLGDDDMVSPLVCAYANNWNAYVIDIDSEVLVQAKKIANALGAELTTIHADLSTGTSELEKSCDIVVGDPFPSGDGSFELMFWNYAANIIKSEGKLITTVSPSHKPFHFSTDALSQLARLGFHLVDLQESFGKYEVFDFELSSYERQIISNLMVVPTVSQTKSLLTAKYLPLSGLETNVDPNIFNFDQWAKSTLDHYLTVQAGKEVQIKIANQRGLQDIQVDDDDSNDVGSGLDVLTVIPPSLRETFFTSTTPLKLDLVKTIERLLYDNYNLRLMPNEYAELDRLRKDSRVHESGELAQIGLAIRAMESWGRWRFEKKAP